MTENKPLLQVEKPAPLDGEEQEITLNTKTPPDASRDGLDINNRATAPNNFDNMRENRLGTTTPTVEVDYIETTDTVNGIDAQDATAPLGMEAQDEGAICQAALEPATQITSLGLPDEIVDHAKEAGGGNFSMFDPENLRVSQDFGEHANVETIHGTMSVRKPGKHEFVRVRPGKNWQLLVAVIESSEDRELWVVVPELAKTVSEEVATVLLRLAVNLNGVPFLWALKISRDGKSNPWNQSAMVAAETAITRWVRVLSNQTAGQYNIVAAKNELTEPKWPEMSFTEILELAFKDRIISSHNHPLLKQLRGEI